MSHDRDELNPEQAERLHRKIERLISGQPAPVLDGDTEELAEIARMLNAHLPDDIPDPGFRAQLRKDLLDPGPRLVPFPPRREPRRYPVAAVVGALALVVVATTVAGVMALDIDMGDVGDGSAQQSILSAATPTASLSASALYASSSVAAEHRAATSTDLLADTSATAVDDPPPVNDEEDIAPTPTATFAAVEPTLAPDSASRTRILTIVDLPPVDDNHVELGALATVAAPEDQTLPEITYSLEGELPQLETSAPAYRFSGPHVDSQLILRGVSDFLGIEVDAEIKEQQGQGRTIYSLSSPDDSVSFTWKPDSGAFACVLPDTHSTADIADLSASAIAWLKEFGYPVDEARAKPVIETRETGERLIHVPLGYGDELPDPVMGHPLRITLVVDPAGRIVKVSGYWLEATSSEMVALLTADQAWQRLSAGEGYWPGDTEPSSPGEFSVAAFSIRYMLTVDSQSNNLVLQPVIAASGTFTPANGESPYETTVYLQAAAQI